jgi:hypothetical protein
MNKNTIYYVLIALFGFFFMKKTKSAIEWDEEGEFDFPEADEFFDEIEEDEITVVSKPIIDVELNERLTDTNGQNSYDKNGVRKPVVIKKPKPKKRVIRENIKIKSIDYDFNQPILFNDPVLVKPKPVYVKQKPVYVKQKPVSIKTENPYNSSGVRKPVSSMPIVPLSIGKVAFNVPKLSKISGSLKAVSVKHDFNSRTLYAPTRSF